MSIMLLKDFKKKTEKLPDSAEMFCYCLDSEACPEIVDVKYDKDDNTILVEVFAN